MSEQSPAFQFYARDFLADTDNLSDAAVGLYVRLLCKQWMHGSLPAEFESEDGEAMIDLLPRDDVRERRRSWKAIAKHFKPYPTEEGRVAQSRLERIRDEQKAYRIMQSQNGQKGVARRRELGQLPLPGTDAAVNAPVDAVDDAAVQPSLKRRLTSATATASATACTCCERNPFADAVGAMTAEAVVEPFIVMFSGAKKAATRNRMRPMWLDSLRDMLGDGHAPRTVWDVCAAVHVDANHAPIFDMRPVWKRLRAARGRNGAPTTAPVLATSRYAELP